MKSFVDGSPEDFLGNVLEPIAASVLLLRDTHQVAARFGAEVARSVRSLDRIDNKDWLPPAILRLWKSAADDDESAGTFLIRGAGDVSAPVTVTTRAIHAYGRTCRKHVPPCALVAAALSGRRYVGIELEEKYCQLARRRLAGVERFRSRAAA